MSTWLKPNSVSVLGSYKTNSGKISGNGSRRALKYRMGYENEYAAGTFKEVGDHRDRAIGLFHNKGEALEGERSGGGDFMGGSCDWGGSESLFGAVGGVIGTTPFNQHSYH